MRILLIHQNLPGQFRNLIDDLLRHRGVNVVGIRQVRDGFDPSVLGFPVIQYPGSKPADPHTHHYIRSYEVAIRRGQAVARICIDLKRRGFVPDLVLGHTAWGELLFVKDVFPKARIGGLFEFFYSAIGGDVGFDPEFPSKIDDTFRLRVLNSTMLQSFFACDFGLSPTRWQKSRFPLTMQENIHCIHEGIRTEVAKPDPQASFSLPNGRVLTTKDEVLTFVCRNLEPYRGFHVFMRTLPRLLQRNPGATVLVVGGDLVSYGSRPPAPYGSWREALLVELGRQDDLSRVFFLGHLPYGSYLKVLQVSSLHVYMTYPFVLSWSMLEAMACGCVVLGSNTPPVAEMIADGENGVLFDFFSADELVEKSYSLLSNPQIRSRISANARAFIVRQFDYQQSIKPQLFALLGLAD